MDRLTEIRQRTEQLVRIANNPYCLGPEALLDGVKEIVPALLSEVDRLGRDINVLTARAEAAEARADAAVEDLRYSSKCWTCGYPGDCGNGRQKPLTICGSWKWRGEKEKQNND